MHAVHVRTTLLQDIIYQNAWHVLTYFKAEQSQLAWKMFYTML